MSSYDEDGDWDEEEENKHSNHWKASSALIKRLDNDYKIAEQFTTRASAASSSSTEQPEEEDWKEIERILSTMGVYGMNGYNPQTSIDAESIVLKERLLYQALGNLPQTDHHRYAVYNSFQRIQANHYCTGGCRFINIPQGDCFQHERRTYKATGEVYVCQTSGRIHLCGERCNVKALISDADECMTCPLTHKSLRDIRQYTLANNRLERDVRVVGEMIYEPRPWTDDPIVDTTREDCLSLRDRLLAVGGSMRDVTRTCELFGERHKEIDFEIIKDYFLERVKNRAIAERVFETEVLSDEHEKKQKQLILDAHRNFINHANEYLSGCLQKGHQGNLLVLLRLFMQLEFPVYNGVYYGADPSTIKRKLKSQVVDIILYMWEKVCTLNSVHHHNIQFRMYALGMLTIMSGSADDYPDGMVVYLKIDDEGKPYRVVEERLEDVDLSRFSVVRVEFIPRIPSLVLAKGTIVQQQKKSQTRKRSAVAAFSSSNSLFGGEVNSACRRGTKNNKVSTRDRANGRMPALKIMPLIYNDIIANATSIGDLDKYCVRTVLADTDITIHLRKEE